MDAKLLVIDAQELYICQNELHVRDNIARVVQAVDDEHLLLVETPSRGGVPRNHKTVPQIKQGRDLSTFYKRKYDAFASPGLGGSSLQELLNGTRRVGIVGYVAAHCVYQTARSAAKEYDTIVCPDLIGVCQNDEQGHRRVACDGWKEQGISVAQDIDTFMSAFYGTR